MRQTYYVIDEECPDADEGYAVMYVEPAEHWEAEHCLMDSTDSETIEEITKAGIYAGELMDATLEIKTEQLPTLKAFLFQHPLFQENEEFTQFMSNHM